MSLFYLTFPLVISYCTLLDWYFTLRSLLWFYYYSNVLIYFPLTLFLLGFYLNSPVFYFYFTFTLPNFTLLLLYFYFTFSVLPYCFTLLLSLINCYTAPFLLTCPSLPPSWLLVLTFFSSPSFFPNNLLTCHLLNLLTLTSLPSCYIVLLFLLLFPQDLICAVFSNKPSYSVLPSFLSTLNSSLPFNKMYKEIREARW